MFTAFCHALTQNPNFLNQVLQTVCILVKNKRTYTISTEIEKILDDKPNKSEYIEEAIQEKHLNDLSKTAEIKVTVLDGNETN